MIIKNYIIIMAFIPFATFANIEGKVIRVLDGDTVDILKNNQIYRIRLSGIDAPEKQQPYGQRSRQNLSNLISQKTIYAVGNKQDRYGRLIATILYNKNDINSLQITSGLAWAYRYKGKATTPEYVNLEQSARDKAIGIWSEKNAVEPWRWRKEKSRQKGD
ncbi:thermonuclease family protein [Rahnella inusitata]|uniref:thermonuclease family protein n=1 Tax=Rahnella inusitata TaxID=58169 RepID=UPI0039BE8728